MPTFWAAAVFAPALCLFAIVLWLGAGHLFLEFALEDERFFEIATKNGALTVFEDEDEWLAPACRRIGVSAYRRIGEVGEASRFALHEIAARPEAARIHPEQKM